MVIGINIQTEYYSTLLFAMGVGLAVNSIVNLLRYYYNTRPENIEAYQEKLHRQSIDLKDERKVQLRNRAGYLTWMIVMTGCFIGSFVAALFQAGSMIVGILAVAAVGQYILATVIYKHLCKKQ